MTPFEQAYSEVADLVRQFKENEAHHPGPKLHQMLDAKKRLAAASSDAERTQLERICDCLDADFDKLEYQLYGLTEEEIKIVEGGA